jgi:predicted aspartyl protease
MMRRTCAVFIAGLWLLAGACAGLSPEKAGMETFMWEAARLCQAKFPSIRLEKVEPSGNVRYQHGTPSDSEGFLSCYRARVRQTLPPSSSRVLTRPGAPAKVSVPIQVRGRSAHVTVTVNGSRPATLLLDTGASYTSLTPALAKELGVSIPPDAPRIITTVFGGSKLLIPLTQVKSIQLGEFTIEDLHVGVIDMPEGLDGVLGMDVLGYFQASVDNDAKQLALELLPRFASSWFPPLWQPGDTWEFQRSGAANSEVMAETVVGEESIDGVPYYVVKVGSRLRYYAQRDLGWHMEKEGDVVIARAFPAIAYHWPLKVGKQWELSYEWENPPPRPKVYRRLTCAVVDDLPFTVPAGTFQALRIVCWDRTGRVVTEEWYAPQVRYWVKRKYASAPGAELLDMTSHGVRF